MTPTMTPPSTTTISSDRIVSNPLGETGPDLETGLLEFQDLENQIEEQRHRHLLTDEEYEALVQDLLTERTVKKSLGVQLPEFLPNFPSSPSTDPILRSDTVCSLGTIIQSTPAISFPLWAQPTYATNQREERMALSIFKVNIIQRVVC